MASFRVITQDTFDEAMRENMEEFDMDKQEAINDAVAQFKSQGVDLTNIDLSGGVGKEEVLSAIHSLLDYKNGVVTGEEEVNNALNNLAVLCHNKHEYGRRNQYLMGKLSFNH